MWHTYATLIVLTHVRVYECMRVCKYCVYLCVRPTPAKPGLASRVCANPRAVACQRFKRNFRAAVVVRLLSLPLALSLSLTHFALFDFASVALSSLPPSSPKETVCRFLDIFVDLSVARRNFSLAQNCRYASIPLHMFFF